MDVKVFAEEVGKRSRVGYQMKEVERPASRDVGVNDTLFYLSCWKGIHSSP
jgi:hypothetical protein